jgi:thrombospondin type 3 repeat protein
MQSKAKVNWAALGLSVLLGFGMLGSSIQPAAAHGRFRDLDRDGRPNCRDRDKDGDGIRNRFDRHPKRFKQALRDTDRDGLRNRWDWDRDGDGVPNWRDKYPRSAHRGVRDRDKDGVRNSLDRRPRNSHRH